jgi:hypothetical protein
MINNRIINKLNLALIYNNGRIPQTQKPQEFGYQNGNRTTSQTA